MKSNDPLNFVYEFARNELLLKFIRTTIWGFEWEEYLFQRVTLYSAYADLYLILLVANHF